MLDVSEIAVVSFTISFAESLLELSFLTDVSFSLQAKNMKVAITTDIKFNRGMVDQR